jgi:ATP-dependent RNA circularization protein (DNA/RNA ligase family)
MDPYHKIHTVFKRDPDNNYNNLLHGHYALPEFEFLRDNEWVWTEKVDGTNIRIMMVEGNILFGGKSNNASIPAGLMNRLTDMFSDVQDDMYTKFPDDVCLYGEGFGGTIQTTGATYGPDQDFVLFDVRVGPSWLPREDVEDTARCLHLNVVPEVGRGNLAEMVEACKSGINSIWGDFDAEGIVARPAVELCTRAGQRMIAKIKTKDFVHE